MGKVRHSHVVWGISLPRWFDKYHQEIHWICLPACPSLPPSLCLFHLSVQAALRRLMSVKIRFWSESYKEAQVQKPNWLWSIQGFENKMGCSRRRTRIQLLDQGIKWGYFLFPFCLSIFLFTYLLFYFLFTYLLFIPLFISPKARNKNWVNQAKNP